MGSTNQTNSTQTSPSNSTLLNRSVILSSVQTVYGSLAAPPTEPESVLPSAQTVSTAVYSYYQNVSKQAEFLNLSRTLGPRDFQFGLGNRIATGVSNAYFGFEYASGT